MKITVGVVYDQIRWEEKTIIETAKKRGIKVNLIDSKSTFFNITGEKKTSRLGDVILQRCISYFRSLHLTALLEAKGYSVVNNFNTTLICGNKLLTTLILTKANIPTPKTSIAFTPETALKALKKIGYPAILKPVVGSWGRLIAPLKDRESAQAIFEEREYMYPLYQVYYIQEMIKRPPRDIRCFVVGDEVIAAIYRYSLGGDWKTNIARGGSAEYCKVTNEIEELSLKAAEVVGGGILGVDMMESKEGMLVHEINHTVEFQATETGSGVNIPKFILGYLIKKVRK